MSLIISLLRNYEPLPETSEADAAESSSPAATNPSSISGQRTRYGRSYTTDRGQYVRVERDEETDDEEEGSSSRSRRLFNYDSGSEANPSTTPRAGIGLSASLGLNPAPASFFMNKRNPALYPGLKEKFRVRDGMGVGGDAG